MDARQAYRDKMEAQLTEWRADVDKLKAKLQKAGADAKIKRNNGFDEIRSRFQTLEERFQELKSAGENRFEAAKKSFEAAADEFHTTWKKTTSGTDIPSLTG